MDDFETNTFSRFILYVINNINIDNTNVGKYARNFSTIVTSRALI